jgi:hypothetical protein
MEFRALRRDPMQLFRDHPLRDYFAGFLVLAVAVAGAIIVGVLLAPILF